MIAEWQRRYRARCSDPLIEVIEACPRLPFSKVEVVYRWIEAAATPEELAYLGVVDRWYLLTRLLGRSDMLNHRHPIEGLGHAHGTEWLYERCREVEAAPDDHLDLWAREHYKSTIITFGGSIQEILRDPEITIGIFSFNRPTAKIFLAQIKRELESNRRLQALYPHVLWSDPRNEAPRWGLDGGLIVKRRGNPKESTVEAWGLVDGQPTGRHFRLRIYDDVVTRESVTTADQVKKTTHAWELSDNLGTRGGRRWHIGTRYSFADSYQVMIDRKVLRVRLHPATHNGLPDGIPVFLTPEEWERKKIDQPSQYPAQMLQNPAAGQDTTFRPGWFKGFLIRPHTLNVYILVDPSKGRTERSDNTAMAVIGVDAAGNKYLLDGYRHRMKLAQRWENLKFLHRKWTAAPGVLMVRVGYEQYGLQTDIEAFQERMELEKYPIDIEEVSWPRDGGYSKEDRVERIAPDMQRGRWLIPAVTYEPNRGYTVWRCENDRIVYADLEGDPREWREAEQRGEKHRIQRPIRRIDESRQVYDLTRAFIEEALYFPYSVRRDLVDAASRIYDMDPTPPKIVTQRDIEPPVYADGSF